MILQSKKTFRTSRDSQNRRASDIFEHLNGNDLVYACCVIFPQNISDGGLFPPSHMIKAFVFIYSG